MNSPACGDNIRDPGAAQKFIRTQSKYEGMTPMGSQLEAKILHPFLGQALFKRNLEKPMLVGSEQSTGTSGEIHTGHLWVILCPDLAD